MAVESMENLVKLMVMTPEMQRGGYEEISQHKRGEHIVPVDMVIPHLSHPAAMRFESQSTDLNLLSDSDSSDDDTCSLFDDESDDPSSIANCPRLSNELPLQAETDGMSHRQPLRSETGQGECISGWSLE
ncbi:hypothetical protein NQ318_022933 [Aromia moschata]|uniref:Uncharacterized protein n=1 Tax=Aromia moschata TaxID=1265417 RepID=A0AAV8XCE2_9CUCU|nr:hypothetical protein NQ318_022933 [Aromia moschata]